VKRNITTIKPINKGGLSLQKNRIKKQKEYENKEKKSKYPQQKVKFSPNNRITLTSILTDN